MNFLRFTILLMLLGVSAHAQRIRIATAHLSSATSGNYNSGEGLRVLSGLNADIVMIQQFAYTAGTYQSFATTALGSQAGAYVGSGSTPTGILSRYPILDSGEWPDDATPTRTFSWAKIGLPGDKFLWAVSVHFVTTSATNRNAEASALVAKIQSIVPSGDYLAIGGNLNNDTATEALFTTLGAVVTIPTDFPADQANNTFTNAARTKRYDHVLFNAGLEALKTPTVIGAQSFPNGLVVDTRVYTPLADLAPAQLSDCGQFNHMPVLRDIDVTVPPIEVTAVNFAFSPAPSGSITFRSTSGNSYQLEASPDLTSASWQSLGSISAATGSTTTLQIVPANPAAGQIADPQLGISTRRFYRISR